MKRKRSPWYYLYSYAAFVTSALYLVALGWFIYPWAGPQPMPEAKSHGSWSGGGSNFGSGGSSTWSGGGRPSEQVKH
jgi:hypothetical protein